LGLKASKPVAGLPRFHALLSRYPWSQAWDDGLMVWSGAPYIISLDHGGLPDTLMFHVKQVAERVNGKVMSI
jgi:hypothetical protein